MIPLYAAITLLFTLFSKVPLFYFSPLIVWVAHRKPLIVTLWTALSCGLVIDLLSPYPFFALHSLTYTLSVLVLSRIPFRLFFPSVALFSLVATVLQALLLHPPLSWGWVFTDLICLPLCDAIFGIVLFNANALRWAYGRAYRWQKRRRRDSHAAKSRN